jgi:NADH:ubiquinone oxidoreductase subunit F (NADH-binding)
MPCRIGSQKLVDLLTGWTRGISSERDHALIAELCETLKLTSICGLGQFIPYPIQTVLRYFHDEVTAHFVERRCPAGVCPVRREPTRSAIQ